MTLYSTESTKEMQIIEGLIKFKSGLAPNLNQTRKFSEIFVIS